MNLKGQFAGEIRPALLFDRGYLFTAKARIMREHPVVTNYFPQTRANLEATLSCLAFI